MWVNDKNNVEDITNDVTKVNATNYGNLTYKVDELQLYLQTLMLNNFNHYKILGNSKSAWTSESWSTIDDGVLSEDSVNFIQNGKSLKFTGSEEGDGVHLVTTNIDMTETDDYWEVEDNDYITLWVYITSANLTNLGSATIDLEFYYEAIGNRNHYFSYDITPLLTDGFNFLKIKKTDFVETGTAFWQDIQGIGFIISTDDPTSEVTFSFDMLMMVSKIYKPFIIKAADEALNSSITLQQDNDFVTLLPPNGTFEIDLILAVDATSATPDIQVAWGTTGDISLESQRVLLGPGTDTTSIYNASDVNIRCGTSLTSAVAYGLVSSGYAYINEKFIVKTLDDGGVLSLEWSQNVSDASYITVKAGSYMKVTHLN